MCVLFILFTFTALHFELRSRHYSFVASLVTYPRIVPWSPIVPLSDLQARRTSLLFEVSHLMGIVPATFGFLYHLSRLFDPHLL
jgi:hypothetical protein